jgi:hypothetical protein
MNDDGSKLFRRLECIALGKMLTYVKPHGTPWAKSGR